MSISKKQTLGLLILPIAVLLFSGCGKQTTPKDQIPPKAPAAQQQAATQPSPAEQLAPLPADNKQAIDGEIQNIDKELSDVDASISTNDVPDGALGL